MSRSNDVVVDLTAIWASLDSQRSKGNRLVETFGLMSFRNIYCCK